MLSAATLLAGCGDFLDRLNGDDGEPAGACSYSVGGTVSGLTGSVANGTGTIGAAPVNDVAISCAFTTHTVGGTVSGLRGEMVLQNSGADDLMIAANGAFTFATAAQFGSAYAVTWQSLQFANQTCTVSNGTGSVARNVSNVAVACVAHSIPNYAYVANSGGNTVSQYTIGANGRLSPMSAPTIAAETNSRPVVVVGGP